MSLDAFEELLRSIAPLVNNDNQQGCSVIDPRKQLLSIIWLLGIPDSYRFRFGDRFDMAKSLLATSFVRVITALCSIAPQIICRFIFSSVVFFISSTIFSSFVLFPLFWVEVSELRSLLSSSLVKPLLLSISSSNIAFSLTASSMRDVDPLVKEANAIGPMFGLCPNIS